MLGSWCGESCRTVGRGVVVRKKTRFSWLVVEVRKVPCQLQVESDPACANNIGSQRTRCSIVSSSDCQANTNPENPLLHRAYIWSTGRAFDSICGPQHGGVVPVCCVSLFGST